MKIITQIISVLLLSILVQNVFAQAPCTDNTHSTNALDSWISCQTSQNPNTARGIGHWIQYDLGAIYTLTTSHFWNYNTSGSTNQGVQNYYIDYSTDGVTWLQLGNIQSLSEATGVATYTGETGPNFGNISARYIVLTLVNNHDNTSNNCIGISEVRFDVTGNPCFDNLTHPALAVIESDIKDYESANTITSNALILSNASVDYDATTCVELTAGFEVQTGAVFEAFIDGCNDGNGGINTANQALENKK